MNTHSKEVNKSNNESDLIIFSLKNKNHFANNEINESIIKPNHHFSINKNNNSYENKEENKFTFTNSIIREKIAIPKIKIIEKQNENNEEFLSIYKLLNINPKKFIKKLKAKSDKIESYDNKKINRRNYDSSNLDEKNNNIFNPEIFPKKISVGLQTQMNENSKTINYDSLKKRTKLNIPIKNNHLIKNNFLPKEDIKSYRDKNYLGKTITITNIIREKSLKKIEKENSKEKKNGIEMADYNNYINFPEIKENHKIKYKNVPLKRRTILNTINLGDFNFPPKKRYFISKITKMNHLIRNRSNLDNLNQLKVEENKDSMSLRELYRNMVLLHPNKKNNKKYKPELRKKQILEYINKNSIQSEKQINKKINSNLLSLENYVKYQNRNRNVKFKRNKNRLLMEELKLENNKKYFGSVGKQIEDNENFFNNILKSFSRTNDRINKTKIRMENCKNYLINIQTMMELNNKSNKK